MVIRLWTIVRFMIAALHGFNSLWSLYLIFFISSLYLLTDWFMSNYSIGSTHTPGRIGEETRSIPHVADGEGRTRLISRIARRAVERPPVVPRYIACPDAHPPTHHQPQRAKKNSSTRHRGLTVFGLDNVLIKVQRRKKAPRVILSRT